MASFAEPGPILTASSGKVKAARKLARRAFRAERRLFLAEGWKALEAALSVPGGVVEVFATPAAAQEYDELLASLRVHLVEERALGSLADSVTPQGLVAVCRFVDQPTWPRSAKMLAICADVRDPGNAGTIIRTADAFGIDAVVLAGQSVDPYNPKTVRATVGSLWHVPLSLADDPAEVVARLQGEGFTVLAADGAGELSLTESATEALMRQPHAWLFGNEAWGLPEKLAAGADHRVRIPIVGRAESLNLATAAAVCLHASSRHAE